MNLLLFEAPWERICLESGDSRAEHLRRVLRVAEGSEVYVGFVDGPRAKARVESVRPDGAVELRVVSKEASPHQLPVTLLVGLPRPHTAKRILFEAASLGVGGLHFFKAARTEPSYARSSLWQGGEWRERLHLGAEQGFTTRIPRVGMHADLQSAITALGGASLNLAFDNYEAEAAVGGSLPKSADSAVLALGPERGWTAEERDIFRKNGWKLVGLGAHVLRAETACVAAVSAVSSAMGWW